jgi:hypothetical protein
MAKLAHGIMILLLLLTVGCSKHFTTLQKENDMSSLIYQIPEDRAFQMAYWAITSSFPNRKITEIEGPIRGYSTYFRIMLDTYTQQILVFPAMGSKKDGKDIKGYYFEVSGGGTTVIGRQKNVNMYEQLSKALADTGAGVVVTNVRPSKYETTKRAEFNGGPRYSQDTKMKSDVEVLKDLNQLHKDGIISDAEFEAKKKEILQRM